MSTTATVDTNEGWIFAGRSCTSEFPITSSADNEQTELPTNEPNNDWGIATTTTDGWGAPPATPAALLSAAGQPHTNNHASLHWTACYDDYCNTHRQSKDNNYYLHRIRRRRATNCDCPLPHPNELLEVTRELRLNPAKACANWYRGKWVCPECRFLVNMENHHLRCSAAAPRETLADITPLQEDQENMNLLAATAALQDEQLAILGEIVTMIHQTTTQDARRNHVVHRMLAQRMNEFHYADQQQLEQMTNTLGAIITEQQRMNEQLQAQQQASWPVRIYRTPIRRRTLMTRHGLTGASVWTGDVLSRTWRDRLLGTGAGATLTLVARWLVLVSAAAAAVILRA